MPKTLADASVLVINGLEGWMARSRNASGFEEHVKTRQKDVEHGTTHSIIDPAMPRRASPMAGFMCRTFATL